MLEPLKNLVKGAARLAGLDVRKIDSLASEHHRLALLLADNHVDLVLDIGANVGQWAMALRHHGYSGQLISFEPMSAEHKELQARAKGDPLWSIAPRIALGDRDAEVRINVAGNSVSSSLLPMLQMHRDGAPQSSYVGTESVPMKPLDSLLGTIIPEDRHRIFCKLDVQGYEAHVLAGAQNVLSRTVGLQMEMSFVPLYDGQPLFAELLESMTRSGFEICGFSPAFVDPRSGRMLQVDGVFFRKMNE